MKTQNSKLKTQNLIDKLLKLLYHILFLFTPLVMTSITSELFEFNKMIFIYIITTLILFFWILKMIIFKKIILKKTILDIPIMIFFLSQAFSTILSIDRHTSFFGYYGRFNGGLLSIITYIILFYGFVSNFEIYLSLQKLLKTSLFSSLIVIFWGLPGKFGHDLSCLLFTGQFNNSCWTDQFRPAERMFSTLGQPNWLGAYLAINFFIGLYFLLKKNGQDNILSLRSFSFFYLVLNFTIILFTHSRSALFSVVFGLGLFFVYIILTQKEKLKRLIILFSLLLIPILIFKTGIDRVDKYLDLKNLSSIFYHQKSTINPPSSIVQSNVTESLDIRRIVWQGAIELGKRYPLFGTGVETFAYSYYFVRPIKHNSTSEWDFLYNKAHNEYLNYLATTGFVGLGAYLLVIGLVSFLFIKRITNYQLPITKQNPKSKIQNPNQIQNSNSQITNNQLLITCLLLAYISILITNFFGFSTTTINLFFYLIPGFLIVLNSDKQSAISHQLSAIGSSLLQKIAIVILLFSIFYFLFSIFRYWLADILYAKADTYSKTGHYQEAANLLSSALRLKYEHVYEDKLSYTLANLSVLASYQKQSDLTKKLMILSSYYNQKSLSSSPKNIVYWKTKAKSHYLFYQITLDRNEIEKGISALVAGQKLSPTDPKIPYSLAVFYSLLDDKEKSQEAISYSLNLKPDFQDAQVLKEELLKKFKD